MTAVCKGIATFLCSSHIVSYHFLFLYQVMVVLSNIMLFSATLILLATLLFCVNVSFQNFYELVDIGRIFGYW